MFINSKNSLRVSSLLLLIFAAIIQPSCESKTPESGKAQEVAQPVKEVPLIKYVLHRTLKHDTTSYTQGLLVNDGQFFESTGSPAELKQTHSVVGRLDTLNGKIKVGAELDRKIYFGEGIAILKNTLYQLTYKNQVGFIYDAKTFKPQGQFGFSSKEGWGLTTDGKHLIMSDGSDVIKYLDPADFKVVKTLHVTNKGYAEIYLNELEFIEGRIFANVYGKNYVVAIDTLNGEIDGIMDLSALASKAQNRSRGSEVMNGIAFDSRSGKLYVTGKLWPELYELEIRR